MNLVSQAGSSVFAVSNFVKDVKWSPDGTCLLSNSRDHTLRLFEFNSERVAFFPSLQCQEGEDVLDYCWYPGMNSLDASSCCFLSTSQEHPIHLWDAYSGKVRASYVAYDPMDDPKAAYAVAFSPTGDKVYGGFNKSLCVWDVNMPGRTYNEYSTVRTSQNKKRKATVNKELSLNGILSVVACNPDHSGIIACGSFNSAIGLYDSKTMDPLCILWGHVGGVTHLKWTSCGKYLFSGGRKDNFIRCWDVRNTQQTLFTLPRLCSTNQRLHFDIDSSNSYLASGNQQGDLIVYDLTQNGKIILQSQHHLDSCSSVSFHPTLPFLASCSGQRHGCNFGEEVHDGIPAVVQNTVMVWAIPFFQSSWSSSSTENLPVQEAIPHWLQLKTDDASTAQPHWLSIQVQAI